VTSGRASARRAHDRIRFADYRVRMGYELAQVNVARLRAPLDAPQMAGFVAAVDPVLRLAQECAGFVWRYADGHGHNVTVETDGDATMVVNLSVWTSYEALHAFTYRSPHGAFIRKRDIWFVATPKPSTALWWVPAGTRPTLEDALRRLTVLRRYGPSPRAFGIRHRYQPDGEPLRTRHH
jgi:hypothetical protein